MSLFGVVVINLTYFFIYFIFVSVHLEGLFYSLFELISFEVKQPKLLSLLVLEIKDKQLVSPGLLSVFDSQKRKHYSVNYLKVVSYYTVYTELYLCIVTYFST